MIKWNEVTWYSRMASIVVFVGIMPVVNFFIGVQYERTQRALIESGNEPAVVSMVNERKLTSEVSTTTKAANLDGSESPASTQ